MPLTSGLPCQIPGFPVADIVPIAAAPSAQGHTDPWTHSAPKTRRRISTNCFRVFQIFNTTNGRTEGYTDSRSKRGNPRTEARRTPGRTEGCTRVSLTSGLPCRSPGDFSQDMFDVLRTHSSVTYDVSEVTDEWVIDNHLGWRGCWALLEHLEERIEIKPNANLVIDSALTPHKWTWFGCC